MMEALYRDPFKKKEALALETENLNIDFSSLPEHAIGQHDNI